MRSKKKIQTWRLQSVHIQVQSCLPQLGMDFLKNVRQSQFFGERVVCSSCVIIFPITCFSFCLLKMVSKVWKQIWRIAPTAFAWAVFSLTTSAYFAVVVPGIIEEWKIVGGAIAIGQTILTVSVLNHFFMATVMDPGVIPKATESEEQQYNLRNVPTYKKVAIHGISVRMKWCATCHFFRPPRCSHCSSCDHCILGFDHHCPWLNNCIGQRNYHQFFLFINFMWLHGASVFCTCLYYTLSKSHNIRTFENIFSICCMLGACGMSIPVIGLTCYHVYLVLTGRTTNEMITKKFRSGYNPFNKGSCRNMAIVCCAPQMPRFADYIGHQEIDVERMASARTSLQQPQPM